MGKPSGRVHYQIVLSCAKSKRSEFPGTYQKLEPLCDVLSEVFQSVKKDAAKTSDLKLTPN